MATSNDKFFDAMVRHQIGLLRFSKRVGRQMRELLDATEKDIRAAIRDNLRGTPRGLTSPASIKRVDRLIEEVEKIRMAGHKAAAKLLSSEMAKLSVAEAEFVDKLLKKSLPAIIDTSMPSAKHLRKVARTRPFLGRTLKQWSNNLARADIERITSQIRIGAMQGEGSRKIGQRVTGTAKLNGKDGVTQIYRRNADAIATTAVNAISGQSRTEHANENKDIIGKELFVAILDSKTTAICRCFDGQVFPVGEGPMLPLHIGERSMRIAVIDGESVGRRPSKPVHERQMLVEYAREANLDRVPRSRGALPFGHKGKFDEFSRRRARELIGRANSKTTYAKWLKRQPAGFQDGVLGKTKGALFRRGNLDLCRTIDSSGREFTLAQLARSDAASFRAANLDPNDFL